MRTSFDAMLAAIRGRKWRLTSSGAIRCGTDTCPLVAAGLDLNESEYRAKGGRAGSGGFDTASRVIGYAGEVDYVLEAADWPLSQLTGRARALRRKMLKAFGLTEEE